MENGRSNYSAWTMHETRCFPAVTVDVEEGASASGRVSCARAC